MTQGELVNISAKVSPKTKKKLEEYAEKTHRSQAHVIRLALNNLTKDDGHE